MDDQWTTGKRVALRFDSSRKQLNQIQEINNFRYFGLSLACRSNILPVASGWRFVVMDMKKMLGTILQYARA